eukprot:gene9881-12126_t
MRTSTRLYCLGLSALVASACRQQRQSERSSVPPPSLGDATWTHTRPTTSPSHAIPSQVGENSVPGKRADRAQLLTQPEVYDPRRRWLGTRAYWLCQLIGWGGLLCLYLIPLPLRTATVRYE